jgi:hypothetical protein
MVSTTQTQTVQVTCVTVAPGSSGHEAITHLGGSGWRWTKAQVIAGLESPTRRYSFFTQIKGKTAWVKVVDGPYGKYVQTWADGYPNNNLLELQRCY